ncbi:MAG: hypothetical protein ACRD0C_11075 [Acidimicrobiia bacterium]
MERLAARQLLWPELILAGIGVVVILVLMVRTASADCHHWKERITYVGGAYLAAAGEEEFPMPERGVKDEHAAMQREARRVLADRPLGCL